MSYTLRIIISGQCLFVPEPGAADGPRMNVLMPSNRNSSACHRHVPMLTFDAGHLTDPGSLVSHFVHVKLEDVSLDIGTGGAGLAICDQIADLGALSGGAKVDAALVADAANDARIVSRLRLGGGAMHAVAKGVCWELRNGTAKVAAPRRLAHRVEWTMSVPDGPLQLTSGPLNGNLGRRIAQLFPMDDGAGGQVINLAVHHVPPADLPEVFMEKKEVPPFIAPHFLPFYELLVNPTSTPLPYLHSDDACPAGTCAEIRDLGGSPYTCMVGGAPPLP